MVPGTALDCKKHLDYMGKKCKVNLKWVKGHTGNPLNEWANQLARRGAEEDPQGSSMDHGLASDIECVNH